MILIFPNRSLAILTKLFNTKNKVKRYLCTDEAEIRKLHELKNLEELTNKTQFKKRSRTKHITISRSKRRPPYMHTYIK